MITSVIEHHDVYNHTIVIVLCRLRNFFGILRGAVLVKPPCHIHHLVSFFYFFSSFLIGFMFSLISPPNVPSVEISK